MTVTIPIAIPAQEVGALIGLPNLSPARVRRLHRVGQFPPIFHVGGQPLVLVADIDSFIAARKQAALDAKAAKSERMRAVVNTRWARVRAEQAGAA